MQKANVIKSSMFHMDEGDVLHLLFTSETGTPVTLTLNSVSTDGEDNRELPPDAPVALDASDITATTFSANVNLMENTLGFYLDVATDSAFTSFVAGFNNLDIGLVSTYPVTGLSNAQTYYYRFRGYNDYGTGESSNVITTLTDIELVADVDGNIYTYVTIGTQQWMVENLKTTKYDDGTAIPNLTVNDYNDWFLPSRDELIEMYDELKVFGVGGFGSAYYWSSTEDGAATAYSKDFQFGTDGVGSNKNSSRRVRACRLFTSVSPSYNLRDIGPSGGLIFWKSGNDYLEAAPTDQSVSQVWSNIDALAIGTTGTAIGTGQANTTAIIGQVGHTDSAAKLCNDLSLGGWVNDTTGAYCWYNNDIANKTPYGALYNWYAVDNAHGLAPTGWRIPSVADMNILRAYAGGGVIGGGKLKESGLAHWTTPNTGATDDYGFKALGSGYRAINGTFYQILDSAYISCSDTEEDVYQLSYDGLRIDDLVGDLNAGYSVRCMRDVTP